NVRLYRQTEQARAMAETSNRIKDEFLAILSHELRTPLTSIAGWIQMLEKNAVRPDQMDRAFGSVSRNVTVLRRLIEDLLDVSRTVAGKLTIERVPGEAALLIEHTSEAVSREAQSRDLVVHADLESGIILDADPLRFRQIISNLLSNAIKFTPEGGEIFVSLQRKAPQAVIAVADTGEGIPSDLLPHVFERFKQADSSNTRRHGGLGLGLAIVKHLVELHGGTVQAANGPRGGAVFTVTLPLAA